MTKWVRFLIIANVLLFFVQNTMDGFQRMFELYPPEMFVHPWTIVTYMFLHAGFSHIIFNMLGLYFFGPNVEARLGSNRFITLYFIGGISGALGSWIFAPHVAVIGASAAIYGVTLAYAMFWPRDKILLYFVIPVEMWLAVILFVGLDLFGGFAGGGTTAHFAHLGGLAGSFIYLRWIASTTGVKKFRTRVVEKVPDKALLNWKRVDPGKVHEVNRDELNRILDKINRSGLNSLTPEEKRFLMSFVPPDDRPPMVS